MPLHACPHVLALLEYHATVQLLTNAQEELTQLDQKASHGMYLSLTSLSLMDRPSVTSMNCHMPHEYPAPHGHCTLRSMMDHGQVL